MMFRRSAFAFLLLTAMVAGWPATPVHANSGARRLIADDGPHRPTPAVFRAGLGDFEKLPFDGTVIVPVRRLADGSERPADLAFTRDPWQPSEIEAMVAELKEAKPTRARENFLAVQPGSTGVDWFDDTGWRETVDHWRLLARAAKLGGLRGLAFDPASKDASGAPATGPLFHFPSQARRPDQDFAAYAKMARSRGREIMLAVVTEFPEAVILCPGLYSDLIPLLMGEGNPAALLPTHPLGLLPAFLDGWWDAATPKLQIIDGNRFATRRFPGGEPDFNRWFTVLRTQSPRLATPEHRAKIRGHLMLGQRLGLAAFRPDGASPADGKNASGNGAPAWPLYAAAAAALRASDGWLLVEGGPDGRWWSAVEAGSGLPWSDLIPGAPAALARARTPGAAARERLATASPAENRLANGDFAKATGQSLPEAWEPRQSGSGTPLHQPPVPDANQPATASWSGATEAAFEQDITVKAGEVLALGTRLKLTGQAIGLIKVGWKDPKGTWAAGSADEILIPPDAPADAEGWQELAAIVRVPPGATKLVFQLSMQGMAPDDRAQFARAMVVRL